VNSVSAKLLLKMAETISVPWLSSGGDEQRVPVNRMSEPGLDLAACLERVRRRAEDATRHRMEHLYPPVFKPALSNCNARVELELTPEQRIRFVEIEKEQQQFICSRFNQGTPPKKP
jgi:hypothetical protein